jgi:short-subunit dehydrogenase
MHLLLTGASGGIGRALAEAYAAPGTTLSLTARDGGRLGAVASLCRARGAVAEAAALDVTDAGALAAWMAMRDEALPVDLLIANAGITGGSTAANAVEDIAEIRRLFEVNYFGVLHTVEPVLPRFLARRRGHVALMCSVAAFHGLPGTSGYGATKAAVKSYGEALRTRLHGSGVGVTTIFPGFVETAMSARLDGPKPMRWSAERAASRIRAGLDRGRGRIAFPLPLALGLLALDWLPLPLRDRIMGGYSYRVTPDEPRLP